MTQLVRVVCNDRRRPFVAGFIHDLERDRVIRAAPILKRFFMGKRKSEVIAITRYQGWTLEVVDGEGNRP